MLLSTPKLTAQSATVKIEQDSTITKLMATKIEIDTQNYSSKFYTIQLFYGDNKRAQELFENFKQSFPDWEVDLSFETPNYKVQVGRFKDYYLGLNKLKEIKRVYPAAFLLEIKD
ncbi:MAG: SPOR domain-containing protein [Flavobacteriaceae bacterium]